MQVGERWFGVLRPKAVKGAGKGILGSIPVRLDRIGDAPDGTASAPDLDSKPAYAMVSGEPVLVGLAPDQGHGRLFIDVDGTAESLVVETESDGDVDLADFGHVQECLSGRELPQDDPDCQDTKLDGDNDVDQYDVAAFLGCISGPNVIADPSCAD